MNRHAPHIVSVAKGVLLLGAILWFAVENISSDLVFRLENLLYAWPHAVYPAYWFIVTLAGLLLVFPLSLAQDHMMRAAEGNHEEMPVSFWLNGLMIEMLFGTAMGCLISGCMRISPANWWLAISIIWIAYHMLTPMIQAGLITGDDEKKESLGDLREMLLHPLKEFGIDLHDVHLLDEEDNQGLDDDVVFAFQEGKAVVYIPPVWAHTWKPDEVAAVVLHKAWLTRSTARRNEFIVNTGNALVCFGGYALLFPFLNERFHIGPIHALSGAPFLLGWLVLSTLGYRMIAFACYRKWMFEADAAVAHRMKAPDALILALERAIQESPLQMNYPRWAEIMLYHSPSMNRRIARLKK